VHRAEVGRVDERAAVPADSHEPRLAQRLQVERERRRGHPERVADRAGREAPRARPHEQAEDVEPALLRERGQRVEGVALAHHDSKNIEIMAPVKGRPSHAVAPAPTAAGPPRREVS